MKVLNIQESILTFILSCKPKQNGLMDFTRVLSRSIFLLDYHVTKIILIDRFLYLLIELMLFEVLFDPDLKVYIIRFHGVFDYSGLGNVCLMKVI